MTRLLGKLTPTLAELLHSGGPGQSCNLLQGRVEQSCNNFGGETLLCQGRVVTLALGKPCPGAELEAATLKVTVAVFRGSQLPGYLSI